MILTALKYLVKSKIGYSYRGTASYAVGIRPRVPGSQRRRPRAASIYQLMGPATLTTEHQYLTAGTLRRGKIHLHA
jgi:hypothetical protein